MKQKFSYLATMTRHMFGGEKVRPLTLRNTITAVKQGGDSVYYDLRLFNNEEGGFTPHSSGKPTIIS